MTESTESVVDLARRLIRIPSQGGIDDPLPVIGTLRDWLAEHGLPSVILYDSDTRPVSLLSEISGQVGPTYCLHACLDTAPIGDEESWSVPPTKGALIDGWLVGRGSADSKISAAIFAHLAVEMLSIRSQLRGTLSVLFDADEHSGLFAGIKSYIARRPGLSGVMSGYPGNDQINIGARGFWRARLHVFGTSAHSGSRNSPPDNAIVKAASLVHELATLELAAERDEAFSFGPKITVTEVHGGAGYTVVPDRCSLRVDVRLTPSFDAPAAENLVRGVCRAVDESVASREPTLLEIEETWPAYRLADDSDMVVALREGVARSLSRRLPLTVVGPSNIGNYLASMGIPVTCGFGVTYRNLHSPDERVDTRTIAPVYEAYRTTILRLLMVSTT